MTMKVIISVYPYQETGWKGWVTVIEDFFTGELWQRRAYYKADAVKLKDDLKDKSLEDILDIYGTHYFERVK